MENKYIQNDELDEEVYMNKPQGLIMPGNEDKVCKLIKSLYGLKQTLKQWHQKFDEVVLSGYLFNQADKCVYRKFDESGKGDLVCLYVDDMLIFGRIAIALLWILDASANLSRKQHALASSWIVYEPTWFYVHDTLGAPDSNGAFKTPSYDRRMKLTQNGLNVVVTAEDTATLSPTQLSFS
ncbi:zinc finger, CCHC-type containing protein [Tanacetum coccineum]